MVDDTAGAGRGARLETYRFPRGTFFLISPYITHRDPRYFRNPEAFVPTRWARPQTLSPHVPPICRLAVGRASVLGKGLRGWKGSWCSPPSRQTWRMRLLPAPPVEPRALVTLRPKQGIHVQLARR